MSTGTGGALQVGDPVPNYGFHLVHAYAGTAAAVSYSAGRGVVRSMLDDIDKPQFVALDGGSSAGLPFAGPGDLPVKASGPYTLADRKVYRADRDPAACAELTGAELVRVGDVRSPDVLEGLFAEVDERFGRLDTLVNVVGGTFRAPFPETTPKAWDALIRTNLTHVLHACSLAAPRMMRMTTGSIINLTTIEAHRAAPGFAVYAAAKAAVEQFARTLAVELAPSGIRVNNVAPDYVPTPSLARMGGGGLDDPASARIAIPMGRVGTPEDVSNCVVFLASNLSRFVTGTTLHPDGGTSASSGWFNWPGEGWANHVPPRLI